MSVAEFLLALTIVLVPTLITASISWELIERPVLAWIRDRAARPLAVPAGTPAQVLQTIPRGREAESLQVPSGY
jgi:peptidoglycan/LPS O-acetylase OafA/YrhL